MFHVERSGKVDIRRRHPFRLEGTPHIGEQGGQLHRVSLRLLFDLPLENRWASRPSAGRPELGPKWFSFAFWQEAPERVVGQPSGLTTGQRPSPQRLPLRLLAESRPERVVGQPTRLTPGQRLPSEVPLRVLAGSRPDRVVGQPFRLTTDQRPTRQSLPFAFGRKPPGTSCGSAARPDRRPQASVPWRLLFAFCWNAPRKELGSAVPAEDGAQAVPNLPAWPFAEDAAGRVAKPAVRRQTAPLACSTWNLLHLFAGSRAE